ncbi:TPA: MFS transporter [Pseudomonas putida]|jgi:MFS family permease|uniref:Major facilitator superfamily MFS_1 n=1 Tax=Pseudomonas putida (strain GB-1) TaxID=76869 RepID=B0KI98_PSEPG|nr:MULTISPECIES: MFS transporter [Pseudomonas]ABY97674.1 major facilitator superfamily MFS_1 [Pseudomonas putida GB-1]MBP0710770.1 MFS transporter [Pseudomonas sp. T34]MCE1003721.1 MFS transporter [Pseudomonas sp. NMI1173_11]MCK2190217.1 MFS transporter [Pseudomonas sp. MB04B]MDD2087820.1 MFS transporter [Pseudomonas putida]
MMASSDMVQKKDASPRKALIASVTGYAMDGFDLLILGFMLPAITIGLALTSSEAGSLVTWTLLGAVAGGLIFGQLSDRYGRVRMLTLCILTFSIFTGLCAIAQGYWDLLIYRTLAGFGLGGEFGIGMALIAETWPAHRRNRASSYVGMGWQAGVLAAALLTPLLLPYIGWRGMFLVGLLPAFVSLIVRHTMSEPAEFVKAAADPVPFARRFTDLFKDRQTTKASVGVMVLTSVQNFGYYGLMIWMPSYLSKKFGFSLMASGTWTAVTVLGMAFGIWLFGQLADRFGRKKMFLLYQAGAAIMVIAYANLDNPTVMLFAGAIMGIFVNGMIGGYGALISDLYPAQIRATAQNVLFNIGRAAGGFGPLVVGAVALHYSFTAAIMLLSSLYVVAMAATVFLLPACQSEQLKKAQPA